MGRLIGTRMGSRLAGGRRGFLCKGRGPHVSAREVSRYALGGIPRRAASMSAWRRRLVRYLPVVWRLRYGCRRRNGELRPMGTLHWCRWVLFLTLSRL